MPLLLWLTIQWIALLLAAARVSLAARYPEPAEKLALAVMLVAQIGASALLFPLLLRDWSSTVMCVAVSWPFQLAAGFLAVVGPARVAMVGAYVSAWILVLGVWREALRSRRTQLVAVAVASSAAVGGSIIEYLREEFSHGSQRSVAAGAWIFGPMSSAVQIAERGVLLGPWVALLVAGAVAVTLILVRARPPARDSDAS